MLCMDSTVKLPKHIDIFPEYPLPALLLQIEQVGVTRQLPECKIKCNKPAEKKTSFFLQA